MGKGPQKVAYVVFRGRTPGIYNTWDETKEQTDRFSNAKFKGFTEFEGGRKQTEFRYKQWLKKEGETQYKQHSESLQNVSSGAASGIHAGQPRYFNGIQGPVATAKILPPNELLLPGRKRRLSQSAADETSPKNPRLMREPDHYKFSERLSDSDHIRLDCLGRPGDHGEIPQDDNPAPDYISLDQSVDKGGSDDVSLDAPLDPDAFISQNADRPLCQEQIDLVKLILGGMNVFYTGSAGCGKSEVLKCVRRCLSQLGKRVHTIAPTGKAALEINGSTAMSYAGWTPDSMTRPMKTLQTKYSSHVKKRLRRTNVLIIDEVSMMENHFFERLNRLMKAVRYSNEAFGGVQVVVTGDFCQLPPVQPFQYCIECGKHPLELSPKVKKCVNKECGENRVFQCEKMWAFCSDAWEECKFVHVNLTTIHRQRDPKFKSMLEKLRLRKSLSEEDQNELLYHKSDTEGAVKLFPKLDEVKEVNAKSFDSLSTPKFKFTSLDYFEWNKEHKNLENKGQRSKDNSLTALEKHRYDPEVQLRVGMLVVLLANLNIGEGLVNGSQGTIVDFEEHSQIPEQKGEHSDLKSALIDDFVGKLEKKMWPIVQFTNGRTVTIYPDCTINELGDDKPYSLLSRTQIPLMAGWAMTIHKAQGMTLSRVEVDLAKVFEVEQEYVAYSRARSLQGLKVVNLSRLKNRKPDPQVKKFQWEKFGLIMGDEGET